MAALAACSRAAAAALASAPASTAAARSRAAAAAFAPAAARRWLGAAPAARLAEPPVRGGARAPSAALQSARVALRKRFGQHFLKNPDVVRNIVAAANIQPSETVFEIGPGSGNMTVHLLEKARVLYAVELDARLHAVVTARVAQLGLAHKFQCLRADFLAAPLPPFDALVANIPYQISSPVMARFFAHEPLPRRAVLMFQKEFAERLVARASTADYCRLTVNTQLLCGGPDGSVRVLLKVGREQFRPPPKVDSAVVELVPRAGGWGAIVAAWPPLPALVAGGGGGGGGGASRFLAALAARCSSTARAPLPFAFDDWDGLLRLCFGGKNKTLRAIFCNKNTLRDVWRASHAAPACAAALAAVPAEQLLPPGGATGGGRGARGEEEAPPLAGGHEGGALPGGSGLDDDDDDYDAEEDEEAVDVVSEEPGGAAAARGAHAAAAAPRRDQLARLRACIHLALTGLALSDKRPNALSVVEYQALYRALAQGAGLCFKPAGARSSSAARSGGAL